MDISNIWIHQDRAFGLGNFINLTPTIRMMADHYKQPIKVYFDLDFVRDCFLDCEFIEIMNEEPDSRPYFTSGLIDYDNKRPDYIHAYREISKAISLNGELPHTYIDIPDLDVPSYDILFIRGSGSEELLYLHRKMPDKEYYQEYMSYNNRYTNYSYAFTGSEKDIERAGDLFDGCDQYLGDVRRALALISRAKLVVANDSGLAHAAGAMNRPMTILWKNTRLPKNANPGKYTFYKMCQ